MFETTESEYLLHIPILSQGPKAVLALFGLGFVFFLLLSLLNNWSRIRCLCFWRQSDDRTMNAVAWYGIILSTVWFALICLVLWRLFELLILTGLSAQTDPEPYLRWLSLYAVGLITALVGLVGAPLALIRVFTTERQTRTAEQGHMTERISKAVEQLGAEKTVKRQRRNNSGVLLYKNGADGKPDLKDPVTEEVTLPNIEVRLGGIYALERIAQDSTKYDGGRDHIQVIELLCAYVRENAPATSIEHTEPPAKLASPRNDIQTAITVLSRRSPAQLLHEAEREFRLNLRDTNLDGCDFRNGSGRGNFSAAMFHRARLEGANFDDCDLTGAQFYRALLNYSTYFGAKLRGTRFDFAMINRPKYTPGGFHTSINMGEIYGICLTGADISAIDHLGKPCVTNQTFGSKDTKLCDALDAFRAPVRAKKIELERLKRTGNHVEADALDRELDANGFRNWVAYDASDMAVPHSHAKFLDSLGLIGWPFRQ